jgi:hypothetical protein
MHVLEQLCAHNQVIAVLFDQCAFVRVRLALLLLLELLLLHLALTSLIRTELKLLANGRPLLCPE